MVKLFVSGFPLDIDEMDLAKLVSQHGELRTIKLVRDKRTRICKGYGFIEMADYDSAENVVLALDGQSMDNRLLTIKIREEEQAIATPIYMKSQRLKESPKIKRPRKKS